MPGYPTPSPEVPERHTEIVHGWDDEVIPCENAIRFARLRQCVLIAGNRRLNNCTPLVRDCSMLSCCAVRNQAGLLNLA